MPVSAPLEVRGDAPGKSGDLGPNARLIGRNDAREQLATPALVLDLDALLHNIRTMAEYAAEEDVTLRPHAKTHKSLNVGLLQKEMGAVGLCCTKLGEAEVLAHPKIGSLLITSPVVGAVALERLRALRDRFDGLNVVVDNPANVQALAEAMDELELGVFIDIDPGQHRTGVASADALVSLARQIVGSGNLRFAGVQFFSGPSQHIESLRERKQDVLRRTELLEEMLGALHAIGLDPPIVTGSGTGTYDLDARAGLMTELQVGSYIFMDDQYAHCEFRAGVPFQTALTVVSRVISSNWPGLVTIDAGLKAFTGSPHPPEILSGAPAGSAYEYRGDEHGAVIVPEGKEAPELGDLVTLRTPHCDPTVNLYDHYHVMRENTLIDIWPVTARGRSA